MKIEKLKPGMTVYDAHKTRAGNTTSKTWGVWRVRIESVDEKAGIVTASWNGNPPRRFFRSTWSKWRETEPVMVSEGWTRRPATRAELKAMKEAAKPTGSAA